MSGNHRRLRLRGEWQAKMDTEKAAAIRAAILKKVGRLPVVCNRNVEVAVAVHVGCGDPPGHFVVRDPDFLGNIDVATIRPTDPEAVRLMTRNVMSAIVIGPKGRILD